MNIRYLLNILLIFGFCPILEKDKNQYVVCFTMTKNNDVSIDINRLNGMMMSNKQIKDKLMNYIEIEKADKVSVVIAKENPSVITFDAEAILGKALFPSGYEMKQFDSNQKKLIESIFD